MATSVAEASASRVRLLAVQAAEAIANALRLDPRLTVRRVMRRHPLAIEADAARLATILREAGLADQ